MQASKSGIAHFTHSIQPYPEVEIELVQPFQGMIVIHLPPTRIECVFSEIYTTYQSKKTFLRSLTGFPAGV